MGASPEEQEKIMGEWGAWYGQLGEAVVDGGAPFGEAKHLAGDGVADGPLGDTPATGYTAIATDSLGDAAAKCESHLHLRHGGQVKVFTCIDMSGG